MSIWDIFQRFARALRVYWAKLRARHISGPCALGNKQLLSKIAPNSHVKRYVMPLNFTIPHPANDRGLQGTGAPYQQARSYCLDVDVSELTFIPIRTAEQDTIHFLISPFEQEALHLALTASETHKIGRHIVIDGTEVVKITLQDRGWSRRPTSHAQLSGIKPIPGYCIYQHISGSILQLDETINVRYQDCVWEARIPTRDQES